MYGCAVCGLVDLQSQQALNEHVRGQKHLKRARRQGMAGVVKGRMENRIITDIDGSSSTGVNVTASKQDFFTALSQGTFRNIVVFTGAGISTSCGIPDFRTPQTGLFDRTKDRFRKLTAQARASSEGQSERDRQLAEFLMVEAQYISDPANFLSRRFLTRFPELWRTEVEPELRDIIDCSPSLTHHFCSWLHQRGWLRRVYTQNVDGLHTAIPSRSEGEDLGWNGRKSAETAGESEEDRSVDKSMAEMSGAERRERGEGGKSREALLPEEMVVECHGSIKKGDLVMYDDDLPSIVQSRLRDDFARQGDATRVDLVMVFGTALQVAPFCAFPNLATRRAARVLVNVPLSDCLSNAWGGASQPRRSRVGGEGYYHGMYGGGGMATSMTVAGRQVSLAPHWRDSSKYPQQLLAEEECDGFVADFFAHLQQSLQREAAATEGGDAGQGSATDSGGQPEEFS